jgi:hypothetical protein
LTINSASVGKQKLTSPFLKCDEGDRDRSSPTGSAETKSAAAVDKGAVRRAPRHRGMAGQWRLLTLNGQIEAS